MDSAIQQISMALAPGQKPVIIGLAADSGCGKSTFMRRVTACFGGEVKLNPIGRETNTLVSDTTTVICLDDYHLNDRAGRKITEADRGHFHHQLVFRFGLNVRQAVLLIYALCAVLGVVAFLLSGGVASLKLAGTAASVMAGAPP